MKRIGCRVIALGLLSVLSVAAVAGAPEATDPKFRLILGITEGPDPIPQIIWTREGSVYPQTLSFGSASDGRPDTAKRGTRPMVVWARRASLENDIAFTQWNGVRWRPIQSLTRGFPDELDPRIHSEPGGTVHIVWWVNGAETVQHLSGNPGIWSLPREVTNAGRRPSVASWDDQVFIAYERDAGASGQEIVLATANPDLTYTGTPLFVIDRADALDVVLHSEGAQVWMDWKHADGEMAYSVLNAQVGWTDPIAVEWLDPSWTGTSRIRDMIRQLVVAP